MNLFNKIKLFILTFLSTSKDRLGRTISRLPAFSQAGDTISPRVADSNLDMGSGDITTTGTISGDIDHSALSNLDYASSGHTGFLEDTTDVIKDTHIDWGTGANQVSAGDVPIADAGTYYTATEVESALQEIGAMNAEQQDPTGFPNRTDSTISFTDGDLTFSIQPVSGTFDYYIDGVLFTSSGDTIIIDDTEGVHFIYYNGDALTDSINSSDGINSLFKKSNFEVSLSFIIHLFFLNSVFCKGIFCK
jgi:hypothetical protein